MLRRIKNHRSFTLKTIVSLLFVVVFLLGTNQSLAVVQAQTPLPPEEPARGLIPESLGGIQEATAQTGSVGIAWGDPDGPHSVYAWPYTVVQMGHVIQSYQNYSSGTSAAYFHHGIDSIAPNGTDVFTRSGGQVVNVENYNTSDLYWEVAILDPEGYVWQYHHIDKNTIPQAIKNAFTAWKANHATGGFVPANTYIGDIVYWTVTSLGYRFNHTHINILGAGDVYLNPLEFMTPLSDTQAPQIQTIGLLNGNTLVSGNVATGTYGLYVRARDLFLSSVYYLPPYKTEFSMDGGAWTTVWEFDDLPGGASDTTFVNDFYVAPPTCGNYSCRDFYIDLGFTPTGQRAFPNTEGAHSVQVRVWDYNGNATTNVFNYTYDDPNNHAPVANAQSISTNEDVAKPITLTGSDVDGDALTYSVVTNPSHGTLSGTGANRMYTPAANYNGADSFTFKVNDGKVDSTPATVSLTMTPVNDVPLANAQSVSTNQDVAKTITLTGSDVDGDALTYSVVVGPTHGTLNGTAPNFIYTPEVGFIGEDAFTFVTNDDLINSEPAIVSISVKKLNHPPEAIGQTVTLLEDENSAITLSGTDLDGDSLSFIVSSGPSHGTLTGVAPNLIYKPTPNYNGPDSLSFVVNDGSSDSFPAIVSVSVTPVNDVPMAITQSVSTVQDTSVNIQLTGTDIDGDALSFAIVSQPANGVLSGAIPNLVYTPLSGYYGQDVFSFVVNDGFDDSNEALASITVAPAGPVTLFWDNFETNQGWVRNPVGTDSATSGVWERANPASTSSSGTKQMGTTVSGSYDLVTGPLAGSNAGSYDIDGGVTTIQSPNITLPTGRNLVLTFRYYLAHGSNSSTADYLRVKIVGASTSIILQELGAKNDDDAAWASFSGNLNSFAGQTVYILIEAADASSASLVEAGVDDILIIAQ